MVCLWAFHATDPGSIPTAAYFSKPYGKPIRTHHVVSGKKGYQDDGW